MKPNSVVSREEWLAARGRHLSKEKEHQVEVVIRPVELRHHDRYET